LNSAPRGGGTEFGIAIEESIKVLQAIDLTKYDIAFLFLSDGVSSTGNEEIQKLANIFGPHGLKTFVFAFGKHVGADKLQTMANLHGYDAKFLSADVTKALLYQFEVMAKHVSTPRVQFNNVN